MQLGMNFWPPKPGSKPKPPAANAPKRSSLFAEKAPAPVAEPAAEPEPEPDPAGMASYEGPFFQDLDATAHCIEGLREAAKRVERPASLGELDISITPPGAVDLDMVKRYEALGVSRLILMPTAAPAE